ncbi:hypothetical protein O3P69_003489 [Scylla paramamosain]|uniref:Basement membrane-specific heparan sulfate proteoglycan core protein n=1 Tax=Scylla paramamosain TaxID=85552 RepID=A0AAW0UKB1_SCYPA
MASRLPAVTRLLAAVLLAAAFTSGAFQLDDEDLMFDDEDGTRSEAPVAAPMQDGVLGPLSRPKRQFLPYDSNDYVDYTDGSGSGFPPQIYMVKIHILRPWDSRFSNKGGAAFKEFKNEIMQPMQQVLHRVHRDATLEVDSIREGPSGQCMARLVVSMPDHEDRRENLVRNVRNELAKGRLGQLIVNTDYFEVTDYSGGDTTTIPGPLTTTSTRLQCLTDSTPQVCDDGVTLACFCDENPQCPNGEDESVANCGSDCPSGKVQCGTEPTCIESRFVCDGFQDCRNNWDEENCSGTTTPVPMTTTSTRLQCLTDTTPRLCDDGVTLACFCDENPQCPDGEDESVANCGSDCPSGTVQCGTEPTCINEEFICDDFSHCQNNWDEENCSEPTTEVISFTTHPYSTTPSTTMPSTTTPSTTTPSTTSTTITPDPTTTTSTPPQCLRGDLPQFCDDGRTLACFCDNYRHCPGGEDESVENCGFVCPPGEQQCGDELTCVSSARICDGYSDCRNNWDEEQNCPLTCPPNMQMCREGRNCLAPNQICDGTPDCPEGSDEQECHICLVTQFQCDDGKCIENYRRCDHIADCVNAEDEAVCPCEHPNFQCISLMCIPPEAHCDGKVDCDDGSDEIGCLCPEGYFRCFTGGNCINVTYRCDGLVQCPDGSDEEDCPCQVWQWTCRDGGCISQASRCDGTIDCNDKSDEYECPSGGCREGEFKCQSGSCVLEEDRCDGVNQCPDGSDEFGCPTPTCGPLEFTCADGKCVPAERKCDGYQDCADDSDEYSCCSSGQFQCGDGSCVPESARCNNVRDCPDDSDETDCPGCKTDEWTCRDGSCLPIEGRCDGYHQCWDSSDEENCPPKCRPDEFTCWDGSCVPDYLRCDGSPHCPDSSDEAECYPSTCTSNQWTCSDGSCIPQEKRCDQRYDCPDYTDEYNCTGCSSQEWTCLDRSCIPLENHCNGRYDCLDRSDEENCIASECRPDEFRCVSDYSCIPKSSQCNGLQECHDGSDEEQCAPRPTCKADEFACADDGTCIPSYLQCDGRPYCRDASDEHNCPSSESSCNSPSTFRCNNGYCIRADQHCDGTADCQDATDERGCPPLCTNNDFRCDDGTCIPLEAKCNDQPDCQDQSDEANCTCRPDQFRCDDGKCLEQWQKCNTISECSQGEDERSCPCRPEDHLCERDGTCIAGSKVCDGRPDCSDASDELNCPLCGRDEWQCLDGQCIHRSYHCDGRQDCLDNSDESVDCTPPVRPPSTPRPELCNSDQFECRNGQCIARAYKCDGIPDCSDGSDEEERVCTPGQCPDSNQFACTSGECVGLDKRCDGNLDCIDRSDELGCPPIPGISDGDDECSVGEIKCNDGLCIDKSWECDSVPDCFDGADELNCCKTTEFKCGDGSCIPDHFLCDTRFDCTDGSDEHNCECKQDEFHCNSGECVPRTVECDGKPDCRDGSDEGDYCPTPSPCTANEFHCQSGECVSQFVVCDGRGDCFDGSDELQCPDGQPGTGTCSESEFKCRDGSCVDRSAYCDRIPDCRDGSDEDNCTRQCASGEFQCTDRQCIRQESVCNRVRDCYDGSDEVNCPTLPPPPPPPTETTTTTYCRGDQFQCGSGDCIPQFYVCDGPRDCRDGSDEDSCTTTSGFTTSTTTTPPPQNTFQCQDGRIINRQQRCDGRRDCSDGSDEIDCPVSGRIDLKTFPDEQTSKQTQEVVFQCRDEGTTRAPVRWERDRGRPLPEGSTDIRGRLTMPRVQMEHEGVYYCVAQGVSPNTPGMRKPVYLRVEPYEVITASPPVVCSLLEATCRSGECINKTQVCDGRPDCKDSSDEDRCGRCEPNEFQCDNRKCVLKTWLCDSDNDCGDNSDEQYCGISDPDAFCHNNEFMCRSGSQCIPKSFHCDGDNDCMDLSDEDGCRKPEVKEPPPRNVMVWVGETFNITCRVEGVPTPIVLWRLNWGHVPAKCQMTSKNGFGMLVCPDAQPTDQGAYSCEAINGKGSVFATPDAIVVVKGIPINQCQPPSFNSLAISQEDCLSCFCFGITNDCFSTDMFITQLPPPNGDSFTLVGANQDQTQGNYVVRDNDYPLSSRHLAYNLPGTQYSDRVVLNVDRSKLRGPGDLAVYFSLPDSHKRQQLASFGGYLRYRITYSHFGASQTTSHPDVIIRGNGLTLMHVHDGTFQENIENWVDVRFFYGHWFKRVVQWGGRIKVEQPASREDIMMVLENMDLLLIRAQYTDGDFINTTLSNVQMDTAEISRNDQGQAGLVEKCVCPPGYTGISCQDCAPNYTRVKEGPWLGRCVYDLVCGPNEYGDPANGISCQPCPCPLGSPSNQFSSSCYLDGDGQVTCNCQQGLQRPSMSVLCQWL